MNALILIDLQYDFMPGGSLAVPGGDEVIAVANELIPQYNLVVATQDWHPADHLSFASQHAGKAVGDLIQLDGLPQVLWPDHCVQQTRGAQLHHGLEQSSIDHIVPKGTDRNIDSYSGFFDNGKRCATGLHDLLKQHHVNKVSVMGLATDYCVKFTALDAVHLGLQTQLILPGCRGVNLQPKDVEHAIEEMRSQGVEVVS
jgi:nicotinamidase/pyrazinamidase